MVILITDIAPDTQADELLQLVSPHCTPGHIDFLPQRRSAPSRAEAFNAALHHSEEPTRSATIELQGSQQYLQQVAAHIDGIYWHGHHLHAHPLLFFHH